MGREEERVGCGEVVDESGSLVRGMLILIRVLLPKAVARTSDFNPVGVCRLSTVLGPACLNMLGPRNP